MNNKKERGITMSKEWFKTRILDEFSKSKNMTLLAPRWPEGLMKRAVYEEESIYYSEEFGLKIIFNPLYEDGRWTTQIRFEDSKEEASEAWRKSRDLTGETLKNQVYFEETIKVEKNIMFFSQCEVFYTFEDSCLMRNETLLQEDTFDFETKKFLNLYYDFELIYPFGKKRGSNTLRTYVDAAVDDSLFQKVNMVNEKYLSMEQKSKLIDKLKTMDRTKGLSHVSQIISYLQKEYADKP